MPVEDVFTKINREYYELTGAEKKIADYVMLHQRDSQYLSISEMAVAAGVAEATVSRFCRRLGYQGYNAFKLAVASSSAAPSMNNPLGGEVSPEDTVASMCEKLCAADVEAVTQTYALIRQSDVKRAAELILAAGRVLCMGLGGSMILAMEAAHLFSTVMPNFYAVEDSHNQVIRASSLTAGDVVLYFSYSGSTRDMLDVMRLVRERGAHSIVITRFPNSQGAKYADVTLECGSRETPYQLGSIAAKIAQLYLVDVLFTEMCRRDIAGARAMRRAVADALSNKHL